MAEHRYETQLRWSGSTGLGWENYDREHTITAPPAEPELRLTTGESQGDPAVLNPEQLLVMAASSCQMLSFLHAAAKARIDVVEYEDEATGLMPLDEQPAWITEITLRPRIVIAGEASEERVRKLVQTAHEYCYIANSLKSGVAIEPRIEIGQAQL
ncbi:MAG: OsmC family protein [Thermoleophilaceae bacterium]